MRARRNGLLWGLVIAPLFTLILLVIWLLPAGAEERPAHRLAGRRPDRRADPGGGRAGGLCLRRRRPAVGCAGCDEPDHAHRGRLYHAFPLLCRGHRRERNEGLRRCRRGRPAGGGHLRPGQSHRNRRLGFARLCRGGSRGGRAMPTWPTGRMGCGSWMCPIRLTPFHSALPTT